MKRVETKHGDINKFKKMNEFLKSTFYEDPAPLHDNYKSYFNLVDLLDRYWYKVQETHANHHWKGKSLLGVLRLVIINCWVLSILEDFEKWPEYRLNLAKALVKYN